MSEEGLKDLLEIPQVVEIIKKYGFSSNPEIKNMPKMAQRYEISVDVINRIPIR